MERRDRNGFSVKRNNLKQLKESKKNSKYEWTDAGRTMHTLMKIEKLMSNFIETVVIITAKLVSVKS